MGSLWLSVGFLALASELAVAVAPFDALGLEPADASALRAAVEEALGEGRGDLHLVTAAELDRAAAELELVEPSLGSCLREPTCAAALARRAGADRLVVGSAAGLGRTFVLRLALIDSDRGVADREVHRTVVGGFEDLRAALPEQVERLLPRAVVPWYRRWWVWTVAVVGAAMVATAVTLAVLLTDDGMPIFPLP